MGRLTGKTALITGAARGTGAEIARLFVAEGACVILADILDDRGQATAAGLGDAARYRHLDITSEDEWQAAVDDIATNEGGLDILVNNAAILHLATLDATTAEAFERVMRVNCLGPFLGTRACLPLLRASRGAIVNVGSIDSVQGTSLTGAYSASKFALLGLTKVTALENRRFGVRANCICPAAGNREMHPEVVGAVTWETQPIVEERGPELVAPAAVWFACDDSALCNGTQLVLDGGESAGLELDLPDALFAPATGSNRAG